VGSGAVVLPAEGGLRVVTGEGQWGATSAGWPGGGAAALPEPEVAQPELAAGRRDALVAGFVPGIALGWSWPDMLRHAVALAESVTPAGEADLGAYETLLARVRVTGPHAPAELQAEPA
jgi:fructose-1-phosphate kinase PfkB-like protein